MTCEANIIALPETCEIVDLERFRDEASACLENGGLTIDAAHVERCSTMMFQLVLSAGKTADARGVDMMIENPSRAFLRDAGFLGLTDNLSQWMTV